MSYCASACLLTSLSMVSFLQTVVPPWDTEDISGGSTAVLVTLHDQRRSGIRLSLLGLYPKQDLQLSSSWLTAALTGPRKTLVSHQPGFCDWISALQGQHCHLDCAGPVLQGCSFYPHDQASYCFIKINILLLINTYRSLTF